MLLYAHLHCIIAMQLTYTALVPWLELKNEGAGVYRERTSAAMVRPISS